MDWDRCKIEELAQIAVEYDLAEIKVGCDDFTVEIRRGGESGGDGHRVRPPRPLPVSATVPPAADVRYGGGRADFGRIVETKAALDGLAVTKPSAPQGVAGDPKAGTPVVEYGGKSKDSCVTAPLAGIFYRQPLPGEPPYAEIGQRVKKGDVLCLVEAMKMINEIPADRDGVVKEFFIENEQFVEYGSPLVLIGED